MAVDLPEWFEKEMREQLEEPEPALAACRKYLAATLTAQEELAEALAPAAGRASTLAAAGVISCVAELAFQLSGRERNQAG